MNLCLDAPLDQKGLQLQFVAAKQNLERKTQRHCQLTSIKQTISTVTSELSAISNSLKLHETLHARLQIDLKEAVIFF